MLLRLRRFFDMQVMRMVCESGEMVEWKDEHRAAL
jgi:hypothetical protein